MNKALLYALHPKGAKNVEDRTKEKPSSPPKDQSRLKATMLKAEPKTGAGVNPFKPSQAAPAEAPNMGWLLDIADKEGVPLPQLILSLRKNPSSVFKLAVKHGVEPPKPKTPEIKLPDDVPPSKPPTPTPAGGGSKSARMVPAAPPAVVPAAPLVDTAKPGYVQPQTVDELAAAMPAPAAPAPDVSAALQGGPGDPTTANDGKIDAAAVGRALSGVKAPPAPNPLPGAGVPSPHALQITQLAELMKALGLGGGGSAAVPSLRSTIGGA